MELLLFSVKRDCNISVVHYNTMLVDYFSRLDKNHSLDTQLMHFKMIEHHFLIIDDQSNNTPDSF